MTYIQNFKKDIKLSGTRVTAYRSYWGSAIDVCVYMPGRGDSSYEFMINPCPWHLRVDLFTKEEAEIIKQELKAFPEITGNYSWVVKLI